MAKHLLILCALLFGTPSMVIAQQEADTDYAPKLKQATVAANPPVVAIDQGHRNFHTVDGRYAPFARLATADGYSVSALDGPFSEASLAKVNILVVANARSGVGGEAALSDAEIAVVRAWVEKGGSLLLIADHAPFGSAAAALGKAFGVDMGQGYVAVGVGKSVTSQIDFSGKHLGTHPILLGRSGDDRVSRVKSFTGQSLSVPASGSALLILPNNAVEVAGPEQVNSLRHGASVSGRRAAGRAQAVALTAGKGRVVIGGEAAMFTSQRMKRPNGSSEIVGLTAVDNQQFALNVMHWLSRNLE